MRAWLVIYRSFSATLVSRTASFTTLFPIPFHQVTYMIVQRAVQPRSWPLPPLPSRVHLALILLTAGTALAQADSDTPSSNDTREVVVKGRGDNFGKFISDDDLDDFYAVTVCWSVRRRNPHR